MLSRLAVMPKLAYAGVYYPHSRLQHTKYSLLISDC